MPSRAQYVAQRVGARMGSRGDAMQLRRISMLSGPVPYRNPPDTSNDLVVATGVTVLGQAYLGITGSDIIGRLVPGDRIFATTVIWTVGTMPANVLTNTRGIPLAAPDGTPQFGSPTIYHADSLADANAWTVIPVSAPGDPDPAASIDTDVTLMFAADTTLYGVVMALEKTAALGWTEVDSLGITLAAYNAGPIDPPPKVDDLVVVNGQVRAILDARQIFRNGSQLLYPVQVR